jgi:hypothetical protein
MKRGKLKSIEVANKRLLRESFWDEDNGTITEDELVSIITQNKPEEAARLIMKIINEIQRYR